MLSKALLRTFPFLRQLVHQVKEEKSLDIQPRLDLGLTSEKQALKVMAEILRKISRLFIFFLKMDNLRYKFTEAEKKEIAEVLQDFSPEQIAVFSQLPKNNDLRKLLFEEAKKRGWKSLIADKSEPASNPQVEDWAIDIQNLVARDGKNSLAFISSARSPKFIRMRFAPNAISTKAATVEAMGKDMMIHMALKQPVITSHPGHIAVDITLPEKQWTIPLLSEYCPPNAKLPPEISVPVGIGVEGELVLANLADPRYAHWLVGAVTGAGKSVWLRQAICALLRYPASRIRITIIDFKIEGISPDFNWLKKTGAKVRLITNKAEANGFLQQTATDGLRDKLSQVAKAGISSVAEYNSIYKDDPICWDAIFIDEYADIKVVDEAEEPLEEGELTPKQQAQKTEESVGGIAAKGRAGGYSIFLCTQRPSVDIVNGVLKANLPATIALKTRSDIDSRVLLGADGPPAHQLLGKGDLFFQATEVQRCQSLFIGTQEAVDYVKQARSITNQLEEEYHDITIERRDDQSASEARPSLSTGV